MSEPPDEDKNTRLHQLLAGRVDDGRLAELVLLGEAICQCMHDAGVSLELFRKIAESYKSEIKLTEMVAIVRELAQRRAHEAEGN